MKYYLLAGVICLMGAIAVMVSNQPEPEASQSNKDWKIYAVENETKVRPAYFEDMRYKLEEAPELRAPASKKKN